MTGFCLELAGRRETVRLGGGYKYEKHILHISFQDIMCDKMKDFSYKQINHHIFFIKIYKKSSRSQRSVP